MTTFFFFGSYEMIAGLPGRPEAANVSSETMRETRIGLANAPPLRVADFDRSFSA